jgi:hypothetical protein
MDLSKERRWVSQIKEVRLGNRYDLGELGGAHLLEEKIGMEMLRMILATC